MKKVFIGIAVLIVVALSAQSADVSINGIRLNVSGMEFSSGNQPALQAVKSVGSGLITYTVAARSSRNEEVEASLTEMNGMVVSLILSYCPDSSQGENKAVLKVEDPSKLFVTLPRKSGESLRIAFKGPLRADPLGGLKDSPYEFTDLSVNVPLK